MAKVLAFVVISSFVVMISAQSDYLQLAAMMRALNPSGSGGSGLGGLGALLGGGTGSYSTQSATGTAASGAAAGGRQAGRPGQGRRGGAANNMLSMMLFGGGADMVQDAMMCRLYPGFMRSMCMMNNVY